MKQIILRIIVGIVALSAAYVGWQAYSAYQESEQIRVAATALIAEHEELKANQAAVSKQLQPYEAEKERCLEYVQQDSGDFSEFEYCQRYLQLTNQP